MAKEAFTVKRFRDDSLQRIAHANAIISQYRAQGYVLTLRQLYYQFVTRNLIENTERSYHALGSLISDARLAGLIDWNAIEDRTRSLRALSSYNDPQELMRYTEYWYRLDKWNDQPVRFEAWVEKEALLGVLARICNEFEVPYFACKGYVSQSEMYDASKRYSAYRSAGQKVILLHLGDHDPSGLDMTRDIRERLSLFLDDDWSFSSDFEIRRLALNIDQVRRYNPPPNPAKNTDTRFTEYREQYGSESWELDALQPDVIANLIRTEILAERDESAWTLARMREENDKAQLRDAASRWDEVIAHLESE